MKTGPRDHSRAAASLRRLRGDEGQGIIEAAIILPAMIFLILGVIQLTMIQHARIMTDYAAYCAARAGVVFNGDPNAMKRAAVIALSPTMGRTDTFGNLEGVVSGTGGGQSSYPTELTLAKSFSLPGLLTVEALPPPSSAGSFAALSTQTDSQELDFDDIRAAAAQWNLLQVRVQYFYRMRIPFANQLLQSIYFASVGAPELLTSPFWHGFDTTYSANDGGAFYNGARGAYAGSGGGTTAGQAIVPNAPQIVTASYANVYYFPLTATYTMRMQSNLYLQNAPGQGPT